MRISAATVLLMAGATYTNAAFVPHTPSTASRSRVVVKGYLDDLSKDLYAPSDDPDVEQTREATNMSKDQVDRYGPGSLEGFVDFGDEFDGGDGQMGVAGDGNKGLEKMGGGPQMGMTSKTMSAKNAWGTSSGYATSLVDKGMDTQKAQRLENWAQQRKVRESQIAHKELTDNFDKIQENGEADWRTLASFGVERNEEFDMDSAFGAVVAGGDDMGTFELHSRINMASVYEFTLKNDYMGFADFRAAFTSDTNSDWTVTPSEGALKQREVTDFIVKYRPSNPGISQGTLVIDTEDMKKTWRFIGNTA